jgi:hypothetical protein
MKAKRKELGGVFVGCELERSYQIYFIKSYHLFLYYVL